MHVSDFGPVQELYEAAKKALADDNFDHGVAGYVDMKNAVAKLEREAASWDEEIGDRAMELYDGPEVQLGNFCYHNESTGYWVEAWLFVPSPLEDIEEE